MENKELKIGQHARVWEVVKPVFMFSKELVVKNQYISNESASYEKSPYLYTFYRNKINQAFCFEEEVKLIGKLTITKLK